MLSIPIETFLVKQTYVFHINDELLSLLYCFPKSNIEKADAYFTVGETDDLNNE